MYILETMARLLNSRCDFENGFFSCDLPEDAMLLVVKVKTRTGNHTLVEDTEKRTEKFRPWKKQTKDGKNSPKRLPGVSTPGRNDNSITSDSGPYPPSPAMTEFKPRFFEEPEWLSSDKENLPPNDSEMPPSLQNLSLEEGMTGNENEATTWEAHVAKSIATTPRTSSPYPNRLNPFEQLEPETDEEVIDLTDYSERPSNDKRSPRHSRFTNASNTDNCPTPQTSPSYLDMTVPSPKPHRKEIRGIIPEKRKTPRGWPACLKIQPPRVAFKNNDIYMIPREEGNQYEEPKERNTRVFYKLKVSEDPASKNMPHEEDFDDGNYESIDEKETAV